MDVIDWTKFSKRVVIKTGISTVYDAWTKNKILERWFLKKSIFYDGHDKLNDDKNVSSNSTYSWNWYAQDYAEEGRIIKANSKDQIQFTFAGNCIVEVLLSQTEQGTLVELVQKEIPTDNASKKNIRLGCAFGWTFYMLNLKSVLEGGIDLRNKNIHLTNVINN